MATLVDDQIQALVESNALITSFSGEQLVNCRYNMRAGRAFEPASGAEMVLNEAQDGRKQGFWIIKPSETLVVMTKESLRMPSNVYATYGQLNSLARKGLLLMNVSIVEPGYYGSIGCFLVNFSKDNIFLYPGDDVAKICFHELAHSPRNLHQQSISEHAYVKNLIGDAQSYPISFMDIGGVEERSVKKATQSINRSIIFGGAFVAVLVFWSTMEPLVSKYIWERLGVVPNTRKVDIVLLQKELDKARYELSLVSGSVKNDAKSLELEALIRAQKAEIDILNKRVDELKGDSQRR